MFNWSVFVAWSSLHRLRAWRAVAARRQLACCTCYWRDRTPSADCCTPLQGAGAGAGDGVRRLHGPCRLSQPPAARAILQPFTCPAHLAAACHSPRHRGTATGGCTHRSPAGKPVCTWGAWRAAVGSGEPPHAAGAGSEWAVCGSCWRRESSAAAAPGRPRAAARQLRCCCVTQRGLL